MKESLIGQEISLVGAADDIAGVLLATAAAFLEAADADPPEPSSWQSHLDGALAALQAPAGARLQARLLTTADGIQVHLRIEAAPERESSFLCNL